MQELSYIKFLKLQLLSDQVLGRFLQYAIFKVLIGIIIFTTHEFKSTSLTQNERDQF